MKIGDIIIWVVFGLAMAVLAWYLFGNSPTLQEAIIVFILGGLFSMVVKMTEYSNDMKWVKGKLNKMEESFIRMADDVKAIRGKIK
jgi:hypothetical protein